MTICTWCGANAEEHAARHEGPHATWCVHHRAAPRPVMRVFHSKELGQFWSFKADLSDLDGPYLEAAKAEIETHNLGRKVPHLGAQLDTD